MRSLKDYTDWCNDPLVNFTFNSMQKALKGENYMATSDPGMELLTQSLDGNLSIGTSVNQCINDSGFGPYLPARGSVMEKNQAELFRVQQAIEAERQRAYSGSQIAAIKKQLETFQIAQDYNCNRVRLDIGQRLRTPPRTQHDKPGSYHLTATVDERGVVTFGEWAACEEEERYSLTPKGQAATSLPAFVDGPKFPPHGILDPWICPPGSAGYISTTVVDTEPWTPPVVCTCDQTRVAAGPHHKTSCALWEAGQ